jgi:hypothetical protein
MVPWRPPPRQEHKESVWSRPLSSEPVRFSILAPLVALALVFAPLPEAIVDQFYSRDTYPAIQYGLTSLTNSIPIALLDLLLVAVVLMVLVRTGRLLGVVRQRGLFDAVSEAFRRIVRFAGVCTILFMWLWGFNYQRLPLDRLLQGVVRRPSPEVLQAAALDGNAMARRLRPTVRMLPELDLDQVAEALREPFNEAMKQLDRVPLDVPARPKHSLILRPFFTWAGVNGMLNPLGLESIVHSELLPYERPFVLAHEWAHLSGHADEAEASAVGFLACMKGRPELAYSASLYLIMEASTGLPAEMRTTLNTRLDTDVRQDLEAILARQAKELPAVQRTASSVYDRYLRANRVDDGTASYRRAISLILAPAIRDAFNRYRIGK